MMQQMRQNMKLIFWILVVAFLATIVFSWGMGGFKGKAPKQGILASVGGTDISVDHFEKMVQQRIQFEQSKQEAPLEESRTKQLRNEVWDELIRNTLLEQETRRLGIKASDSEISYLIQNNPPDFIKQNEYFQKDGAFDPQKYQDFLRNPAAAQDLMMLEQNYRTSIPSQKFIFKIMSMVSVSETEVWLKYIQTAIAVRARYLLFATVDSKADSSSISLKDVQKYYNDHKEDYLIPEKRRILYTVFKEAPSKADSVSVLETARDIMTRLQNGEDFGELAKQFSDDRTADKGGDLGFFERGRMVPEFDQAVFSTPVGKVSGPISTKFGWHIIKVIETKTEKGQEQVHAAHILLKIQTSPETRDLLRETADGFLEELKQSNYAAAAATYKIKIDTSSYFERRDFIPGVGRMPAAVEFVFNRPAGEKGPVYHVRDGLLVLQILDIQRGRTSSLQEVQTQITATLLGEKNMERAKVRCEEFARTLPNPSELSARAQASGLAVKETDRSFRFGEFLPNIGLDNAFISAALVTDLGGVSKPTKGMSGYYLIQPTEKTPIDSSDFNARKMTIRNELLSKKQDALYNQWLEDAKKKAKLQDQRYLYYLDY
jgi:peptidyl-prolyl cis-trans isomerase D